MLDLMLLCALAAGPAGCPPVSDRDFDDVMESWVIDSLDKHDPRRRLETVADPAVAKLVRMLGCDRHDCRQTAAELILGAGEDPGEPQRFLRPLLWARRHRDPEVRHLAGGLFEALYPPCRMCDGTGWYPAWDEARSDPCAGCGATGYARPVW